MKLLSAAELRAEKGIKYSPTHLRRLIKAKEFPEPVKLGGRAGNARRRNGWPEEEIDRWISSRIAERNATKGAA